MRTLLILNDPAYGTERSYNGLRLAGALARRADGQVRVFLIGDGHLTKGAQRSSLDELAEWTAWADKVVSF